MNARLLEKPPRSYGTYESYAKNNRRRNDIDSDLPDSKKDSFEYHVSIFTFCPDPSSAFSYPAECFDTLDLY